MPVFDPKVVHVTRWIKWHLDTFFSEIFDFLSKFSIIICIHLLMTL